MSNIAYQRLDELLEKRPLPKTFDEVKVELMKPQVRNPVETEDPTAENKPNEDEDESAENKPNDDEDESTEIQQPDLVNNERVFKLVDKRRSSMLDRLAILKRIQNKSEAIVIDEMEHRKYEETMPRLTAKKLRIIETNQTDESEPIKQINTDESLLLIEEEDGEPIIFENKKPLTKPEKKPRKLRIKGKQVESEEIEDVDLTKAVIRSQNVKDRLPGEKEKILIKAPTYYMSNRKIYMQKITEMFAPYKQELLDASTNISCDSRNQSNDFDLLTHQKIVRDYLNLYTPYRGLLLYHGLGSGKTCSSIAIAEGMKTDKRIFVLTPASLKMNFFSEMKKCGDELYKKNQFWEFVSIDGNPEYVGILSRALSLSTKYIRENNGAWLVNVNKEPNFTTLSSSEQFEIDEQLNVMIRSKYTDINYNGMNERKMKELTGDYTRNPFDNAVVIIDEAHNFVSRIVNKIKAPDSISYKLYNYLLSATNAKVILLTGTPIINYPNEIGILYNILRGYIKTWIIPMTWDKNERLNRDIILDMLDNANFRTHDYIEFNDNKLTVTRNPFGFVNAKKRGAIKGTKKIYQNKKETTTKKKENTTKKNYDGGANNSFERYNGVQLNENGNIPDNKFIETLLRILKNNQISYKDAQIEEINNKSLPDERGGFFDLFIDEESGHVKNINTFQRRILGLTSYFRSAQEELLPNIVKTDDGDDYHIVKLPMSPHQFGIYEKIRKDEADKEKKTNNAKRMQKTEEIYKISSTYRVFSRAACNFTFPSGIDRPVPLLKNEEDNTDIDENMIDNMVQKEDINVTVNQDDVMDDTYGKRIETAMNQLNETDENTNEGKYLSKKALAEYSPKFEKILENIMDEENKGLHLLYSHFRTIEGIGVLRLILLQNGMAEFKLKHEGDTWMLDIAEEDMDKPKFVLYTGTESSEEKEIIRNVYNGAWEFVSQNIVESLHKYAENNVYGQVIKLLMITSSGAEGINLKNTRFVHIVEPYWHMVRVEQVVGRARRICSHQDLPEDMRTVKVFLYIATLSDEQRVDKNNVELRIRDISKIDKQTTVTTDEALYEIASFKQRINNEILRSMKETAIDCNIYSSLKSSNDEQYVCYGHGLVDSNQFSSYPTFEKDNNVKEGLDTKVISWNGVRKQIDGVDYAMNPKTNELYDLPSFRRAQKGIGEPTYIGKYAMIHGKPAIGK
tara:strand:- start:1931 stop:5503 length:3573 start_codon:yes stop_codon:yes gene_type:complete